MRESKRDSPISTKDVQRRRHFFGGELGRKNHGAPSQENKAVRFEGRAVVNGQSRGGEKLHT